MNQLRAKRTIINKNVSQRVESKENLAIKNLEIKLCNTFKRKSSESSAVWDYYGQLHTGDGQCMDDENYYCNLCLLDEKKKQESEKASHLSKIHKVSTNLFIYIYFTRCRFQFQHCNTFAV